MPECRNCQDYFDYEDEYGNGFCSEYCEDTYNVSGVLHGYHDIDVARHFGFGVPENGLFGTKYHMGIELEFYNSEEMYDDHSIAHELSGELEGWGVLMSDSSIGLEFISKPMNFNEIKHCFGSLFDRKLRTNLGLCVRENAGLHINISRSAFKNDAALANFVLFINNHELATQRIAGRGQDSWGEWARVSKHSRKQADDKAKHGTEKYQAVRIGSDRVEVRVFKSTSVLKTLLSRVRFCMALVDYCNKVDRAGTYPTISGFKAFASLSCHAKYININYICRNVSDDVPMIEDDDIYDYENDSGCPVYGTPWLNVSFN